MIINKSGGGSGQLKTIVSPYTSPSYFVFFEKGEIPTVDKDGVPMPTTINFLANDVIGRTIEVIVPAHYTDVTFHGNTNTRKILVKGAGHLMARYAPKLQLVDAPNITVLHGINANENETGTMKMIFPSLTDFTSNCYEYRFLDAGTNSVAADITGSDFSSLANITGYGGFQNIFYHTSGTVNFPALTSMDRTDLPYHADGFTMKCPVLTTVGVFNNTDSGTGTLHLYIGPNLSSIGAISSYASRIDIHIPAGDSTTKTTLDAAGLTYTQDYVIGG